MIHARLRLQKVARRSVAVPAADFMASGTLVLPEGSYRENLFHLRR